MQIPIGNCICLLITTFEQIFLNGLWSSWGMMANILKREGYFEDACKPSELEENFKYCIKNPDKDLIFFLFTSIKQIVFEKF